MSEYRPREDVTAGVAPLPTPTPVRSTGRVVLLSVVGTVMVLVVVIAVAFVAFALGRNGSSSTATGGVATASGSSSSQSEADQAVCADFNVRGGTYYHLFVTKVMGKNSGYKSVQVDPASMQRGIDDLEGVGTSAPRLGGGTAASPALEKERATMTSAAAAIGQIYANADTTTLLTAFVGTAIECAKVGHQPTWFDTNALSNGTADAGGRSASTSSSSGSNANPAAVTPPAPAAPAPAPAGPASTFTSGTYEVGEGVDQITPGTYKATCATNGYWARLRSIESRDIVDNDWKPNGGPMIVVVKNSDAAVELGDCTWTRTR